MSLPVSALKAHVALNVKDVGASIEFYRKLFGIDPVKVCAKDMRNSMFRILL